eukprot:Nk52_evm53s2657 gene=Nk52_evmTU53s2657
MSQDKVKEVTTKNVESEYVQSRTYDVETINAKTAEVGTYSESNVYAYCVTTFAALGGVMFGYDTGVIGPCLVMDDFREAFDWPLKEPNKDDPDDVASQLSWVVSIFLLGCFSSALFAGTIADAIGRRWSTAIFALIFNAGGVAQTFTSTRWLMYVGRFVAGLGVGGLSMLIPMYNSELAPSQLRGRLVTLQQLAITFGIMLAYFVTWGFDSVADGWRYCLGGQFVLGTILFFGMIWMPESPRWLVKKEKDEESRKVLKKIRATENIEVEYNQIKDAVDFEESVGEGSLGELFRSDMWLRVYIGMTLQFFQQMTGMNAIMYYAPTIFSKIGMEELITTSLLGAVNFLSTFLAIWLIDRAGRKALLLAGAFGIAVCCLVIVIVDFSFDIEKEAAGYVVAVFMGIFVMNFAYSWGPIGWVIPSEIYPLRIRGKAMSCTTAMNWIGNFAISMVVPPLLSSAGVGGTYAMFLFFEIAMFFWVLSTIPETKNRTLESMEGLFWVRKFSDLKGYMSEQVRCTFKKSN